MFLLGCIVNQHSWMITGGRSLVIDGGMETFKIVGILIADWLYECKLYH